MIRAALLAAVLGATICPSRRRSTGGAPAYRTAAADVIDYLLGRNAHDRSGVT